MFIKIKSILLHLLFNSSLALSVYHRAGVHGGIVVFVVLQQNVHQELVLLLEIVADVLGRVVRSLGFLQLGLDVLFQELEAGAGDQEALLGVLVVQELLPADSQHDVL